MEKIQVTISYDTNKSVSLVFFVDNAKDANTFFQVLSTGSITDKKIFTKKIELSEEEIKRLKLAGIIK